LIKVDLSVLLTQLKQEADAKAYQYQIFSHSIIELLLITINRAKISRGDEIWKPNALFLRFLDMIRTSFGSNLPLIQIAAKLGTTVIKLNELSKQHAGKTAQNVFHGLIASEAKRLIIYEKLTVKEIAYSLGFNDPFYFSAFFKKHTGHSPKAYREKHMVF
jgi:YesN/AraC family two-component response regulator